MSYNLLENIQNKWSIFLHKIETEQQKISESEKLTNKDKAHINKI